MQLLAKQGETQLWTGVGLHEHGGSSLLNDGLLGQICRLFGELIVSLILLRASAWLAEALAWLQIEL